MNTSFPPGPYWTEEVDNYGLIGVHSRSQSHIAMVDTQELPPAQAQATARLFKAAPDLFHLLIQARNQLRLLGDVAPLPSLCHDIDKTIDGVWGIPAVKRAGDRA